MQFAFAVEVDNRHAWPYRNPLKMWKKRLSMRPPAHRFRLDGGKSLSTFGSERLLRE